MTTARLAPPIGWVTPRWTAHPALITAFAAAVVVGLRVWTPTEDSSSTVCFVRRCTGVSCPGCGLTRAAAYLVRGDFGTMWAMHPLVPLFALDAVLALVALWAVHLGRLRLRASHVALWAGIHVPLLLGVWIWRMLGGWLPA